MKWITPLVALTSLRNTLAPFTASRLSVKKKYKSVSVTMPLTAGLRRTAATLALNAQLQFSDVPQ